MTLVLVLVVAFLAVVGAPIFAWMLAFAIMGGISVQHLPFGPSFADQLVNVMALREGVAADSLSTVPLFIFAGYVMAQARTAQRLVTFSQALVGWIPGGLALVTIFACAIFTTFTGASGVTIVAIGGLILPSLLKEGYKEKFSLGLVTGTGSVGLLFPPALPLFIYGTVYALTAQSMTDSGESTTLKLITFRADKFLLAGIVPGLVLVGALSLYAVIVAVKDKVPRKKFDGKVVARSMIVALPELLIPALVIFSLTVLKLRIPEASAFTALYVLALELLVYRDIKLEDLPRITRNAMALVGAIYIIIVAATALTNYFVNARVPDQLYDWMGAYIHSRWTFLLALNVLLLIVGCLMDIFSATLVVVPLIAPAAIRYGIDPYHLGVVFLLNLEIGYLTPPVGLNLFITSFRFQKPMVVVYKAAIPFILLMLGALALVTYVPALTVVDRGPAPEAAGGAGDGEVTAVTPGVDGGLAAQIVWPDAAVWTPSRCEQPEIKESELDYIDCRARFRFWARCDTLGEELDKVECRDMALAAEDWFAQADAGPEPEPEESAPDAK